MNRLIRLSLVFAAIFVGVSAHAQRKLTIISKFDRFDLTLTGGRGEVNGQPANLTTIKDLLPLLSKPLGETCPSFKAPPEITVKEGDQARAIYVSQGVVSDGKGCTFVAGEGLYYFPVHQDFLIGPKRDSIKLRSPVKIFLHGKKILEMRKTSEGWVSDTPDLMVNWDFIRQLEHSLEDFRIRLRVQAAIGKDKPKMIIDNGGQNLEFTKVTNVMWALKKPGQGWLTASDDWSKWGDFDSSQIEDRYAEEIRQVLAAQDVEEKKNRLSKLDTGWSLNLRDMYIKLVTNENEDENIRFTSLRRLKSKPSLPVVGAMVRILENSTNDDIRNEAGVILRLNYPKGPKFKSSDPPKDRQKALDFWRNWWQQKNKGP